MVNQKTHPLSSLQRAVHPFLASSRDVTGNRQREFRDRQLPVRTPRSRTSRKHADQPLSLIKAEIRWLTGPDSGNTINYLPLLGEQPRAAREKGLVGGLFPAFTSVWPSPDLISSAALHYDFL